jgi:flagellar hook-associated protein 3 FlgL
MINATRYRLDAEINRQANLAKQIAKLQTQISTGKRIQAPSDDPIASARISEIGRTQADEAAWTRNLSTATALSDTAYTSLGTLMRIMDEAADLTGLASTGSAPEEARKIYASNLRQLAADIEKLAETRDTRGEPLFRSSALEIPVGPGHRIAPVLLRAEVFGPIETETTPKTLSAIVLAAADAALIENDEARATAMTTALADMRAATTHTAFVQGQQNILGGRIAMLEEQLADSKLRLSDERVAIESVDPYEVIAQLEATKLSLDTAQAVFAHVSQKSLFDYLR